MVADNFSGSASAGRALLENSGKVETGEGLLHAYFLTNKFVDNRNRFVRTTNKFVHNTINFVHNMINFVRTL